MVESSVHSLALVPEKERRLEILQEWCKGVEHASQHWGSSCFCLFQALFMLSQNTWISVWVL